MRTNLISSRRWGNILETGKLRDYVQAYKGELDSKKSPFKSTICHEDLLHIKTVKETDVGATSLQRLTEIFYKTLMKPVQGHFNFELTRLPYHMLHFKNCKMVDL